MQNADRDKPTPLLKLDSTVVLERLDSTASSYAYVHQDSTSPGTSNTYKDMKKQGVERRDSATPLAPIGLDVSIRFGRLGWLMAVAVTALVAFTITFKGGVVLGHFDPTTKDATAQKRLIDDYNSYTGNVASLFGRPIEIFVALAVHLLLLRVIAASLLRSEIDWKTDMFTLATTAFVGFLVTNGLNALNVQPQAPVIEPIISAADLSYVANTTDAASRSTSLHQTFSELSPKNPIFNTVLRNLVLPRVSAKKPFCGPVYLTDTPFALVDVGLEYGFPQRDWQSQLLQEAIAPTQMRRVVNSSNKTANRASNPNDLPMNASVAADLFLHASFIAPYYLKWAAIPKILQDNQSSTSSSVVRAVGLLPPVKVDEAKQREWFLQKSVDLLTRALKNSKNISRSDVVMEFSHVNISSAIHFDSLTLELEVDPMKIADGDSKGSSTWYNDMRTQHQCGPWPMRCMMRNPEDDAPYDPPSQVQVYGVCVGSNGAEELSFPEGATDGARLDYRLHCAGTSNTSLMVMSIGKRFVAESVVQNRTVDSTGVSPLPDHALVTNLRRIYTFTVGKLSWETSDLTVAFNAQCGKDAGSCKGLRFPLSPTSANQFQDQELIVGADALPTNLVTPMEFDPSAGFGTRFVPLVQLHETRALDALSLDFPHTLAADPLLPHNMGNITWDMQQPPSQNFCIPFIEDRIQLVLNNHMYIEHGLQTAYTAATFFLLQNGVVKDVIKLQNNTESLNFLNNTQRVALLASIPAQNAWLTLGGCALLMISLCSVLVWAWFSPSSSTVASRDRCTSLGRVTAPHVVARVMLDSVHFPPLFLHRRVIDVASTDTISEAEPTRSVQGFVIDGLALQPPQDTKQDTPS